MVKDAGGGVRDWDWVGVKEARVGLGVCEGDIVAVGEAVDVAVSVAGGEEVAVGEGVAVGDDT